MADKLFDLVVIGGGPAGYVGAIRAAQLGMQVACVETDKLGGVCLNWGCIPTKALLAAAEFYEKLNHTAGAWGIVAENVHCDWPKLIERSRTVAGQLNRGIHGLFKKNKITHIQGQAKLIAPNTIKVLQTDASATMIQAAHIMIATGARPRALSGAEFDGDRIISSKEAMVLPERPKKLVIVGAGAIGMEFAYFFSTFGTDVTIIEMLDHLLPTEDEEISRGMEKAWRKRSVKSFTRTKTQTITKLDDGVELAIAPIDDESKVQTIMADKVLVAIGVRGRHEELFNSSVAVEIENDHIKVDRSNYQTSVPGVYAVGDVIGPPWLAHVASEEANVCVESLAGLEPHPIDYKAIPACTYCSPQVASMGVTEQACRARGQNRDIDYRVGKFPFQASGKAQAIGATQGFVKIISDSRSGELLGVHMMGENVTELLAEMGLARRMEATAEELITTMHAHPTLSEAVHEAAMGVTGNMIHF